MQIKCARCKEMNRIKNYQIILHKAYTCNACNKDNFLYKNISLRILKVIYIILFGIVPLSIAIENLRDVNIILNLTLSLVVTGLSLLIFYPLYSLIFLHIYNK